MRGAAIEVTAAQGLIKVRTTPYNQNNEAVQVQIANLMVPKRK